MAATVTQGDKYYWKFKEIDIWKSNGKFPHYYHFLCEIFPHVIKA
jgi:hypothetical protein